MTREGPFWDVMDGRAAAPPAAILLGWKLVAVDPEAGTIEVAFTASEQFLNPAGVIQGGFLAAMLPSFTRPARTAGWAARPTSSAGTRRPVRRLRRAGRRDGRAPRR